MLWDAALECEAEYTSLLQGKVQFVQYQHGPVAAAAHPRIFDRWIQASPQMSLVDS